MSDIQVILGRDAILAANDINLVPVECPEWGGTVLVKSMSGAERDHLATRTQAGADGKLPLQHVHARVAAMVIVDSDGKRLFEPKDIILLSEKNINPLDRIFKAAMEISGIDKKEQEEIEGNSAAGETGDSDFD